jgi:hypothetical protein
MPRRSLRWLVGRSLDAAIWRPSHARYIYDNVFGERGKTRARYSDRDRLIAAAEWLARAQDAAGDGGVSGRYFLRGGWSSSYPETTGYIVPTFLALARQVDPAFRERAARCIHFLRRVQLADGSFPGGEVEENRTRPSVFNTAQILHGLVAWHAETGDRATAEAAARAANWLVSQQDSDGCWRKNIYNVPTTYTAHASCWLAQAANHFGVREWARSAERHLDWVLTHVDDQTGWIHRCGFAETDADRGTAVTHTLAYTIWGILELSENLERDDGVSVASYAAERVARRFATSSWLPGVLDHRWAPHTEEFACLTGNAQMALIWFRLAKRERNPRLITAAIKALELVKRAQSMDSADPGIRGAIAGSSPAWGDYLYMAFPNWAAKYFIDALFAKQEALDRLASEASSNLLPYTASAPPMFVAR